MRSVSKPVIQTIENIITVFTSQHQSSVWNNFLLWSDGFLSQNEAENIFYTVIKAMSNSNGLQIYFIIMKIPTSTIYCRRRVFIALTFHHSKHSYLSILGISWNIMSSITSVMHMWVFLREGALWLPVWRKHTLHVFIAFNNGQSILFWLKIRGKKNSHYFRLLFLLLICRKKTLWCAKPSEPNRTENRGLKTKVCI